MPSPARLILLLVLLTPALAPAVATGGEPSVADRLARARSEARDHEYRAAERIYRDVLSADPAHRGALLGLARVLRGVGEHPGAAAIYTGLAKSDPKDARPHVELGRLAMFVDRREEARRHCAAALKLDPESAGALATLARLSIEERDYVAAHHHLERAEKLDPDNTSVLGARSEYFYRTRDMGRAAGLLRRVLELDPTNLEANIRLARGFIEPGRPYWEPPAVPLEYATAVYAAIRKYRALDLDGAAAAFESLDGPEAPDARPAFYLGLIELRRGHVRPAIALLRRSLDREPENFVVRSALGAAWRIRIRAQRAEYGGGADGVDRLRALRSALPTPEVKEIERFVPGYERLLPEERHVVGRAIAPFAAYLPKLLSEGVRQDVLGFEEGITEAKERRWLHDRRTRDGRWYGALRGVEGKQAATGMGSLLSAVDLDYDTFAHEFAHQVHRYALTSVQMARIKTLYEAARKAGRCLDSYAATNEREYFAQGYEAYVSLVKSPFLHSFRRHTRAELSERDPALYGFIRSLAGTPEPDPAVAAIASKVIAFYEWAGDGKALEQARRFFAPPK